MLFEKRIKTHHIGQSMRPFVRGGRRLIEALDSPGQPDQVIYIHVPFCSNICSFCNMNRSLSKAPAEYTDLVIQQIERYGRTRRFRESTIDSIYFGGGTPNVLEGTEIARILEAIARNTQVNPEAEISLETSLTDLGPEKLGILRKAGVNRLSIGIQTFSDRGRKLLGRRGDGAFARAELKKLQDSGFRNINIDLIYNYFEQTEEELDQDLRTIEDLDLAGFSFYSLIVMDESRLGRQIAKYRVDERTELDWQRFSHIVENVRGYDFLELTKLVQPGRDQYKYIRRRLEGKDTFPLGAGAGGSVGGCMLMNPIKLEDFRQNCIQDFDSLQGMALDPEYFRVKRAIDRVQLLSFDPEELGNPRMAAFFQELEGLGYAQRDAQGLYRLSTEGAFWGNNICARLWDLSSQSHNM